MDTMDIARRNIKRRREIVGLRQADMADKLGMSPRSYQALENGETKLDIERLEKIAKILEISMEDLMRPDGVTIHQQINDTSGDHPQFNAGDTYNYSIEKEVLDKIFALKDGEVQALKEENKYLRDKIDQFMEMFGKKE